MRSRHFFLEFYIENSLNYSIFQAEARAYLSAMVLTHRFDSIGLKRILFTESAPHLNVLTGSDLSKFHKSTFSPQVA